MKKIQSKLFSNLEILENEDFGLYGTVPSGFDNEVSLFISEDTVTNDIALNKAIEFFDKANHWNTYCRNLFIENSEDSVVKDYFDFYKEEIPEVFEADNLKMLSLSDMVNLLKLTGMSSHNSESEQIFIVDFTLGYDQLLSLSFNADIEFRNIAWES